MTAASNSDARKRNQPAEDTAPAETLAEVLHARHHDMPGNLLGQADCGYAGCDFYLGALAGLAARVEQARAGGGALRERVETVIDGYHDVTLQPGEFIARLRAALTEGDPT